MNGETILPLLVLFPALLAGVSCLLRSSRAVLRLGAAGTLLTSAVAAAAALPVFRAGPISAARGLLRLDALSAYHLAVMMLIFSLSALYAVGYFQFEIARSAFDRRTARRYGALWFGSLAAMLLTLLSDNLGLMWVGIEATTILTAFLVCLSPSTASLEAMWKYLLMCSVGVAIAFAGVLLIAAAAGRAGLHGSDALSWTAARAAAPSLSPALLKAGFIFLVVGYGAKAGLAPMHNWLPDAHSQAPAPVSAVFSGFMLNAALYCILRVLPLTEAIPGGEGWGRGILLAFGLLSIVVAAAFIVAQHDLKRLLAYHSVEHLGIIALGAGIGGVGAAAALWHTLNHSLCKTLSFFCAGRLGQIHRTHDMRGLTGILRSSPVWGAGLVASLLALLGVAPFALFMSEFLILRAAIEGGSPMAALLFLAGVGVVFVGALKHAISMAWDPPARPAHSPKSGWRESALVFVPLAVLLILGLWMPTPLWNALRAAAGIMGATP